MLQHHTGWFSTVLKELPSSRCAALLHPSKAGRELLLVLAEGNPTESCNIKCIFHRHVTMMVTFLNAYLLLAALITYSVACNTTVNGQTAMDW
jgi:hypothetical protein